MGKRDGHESLCQSSAVIPKVPGSSGTGTYAILKNKRYYDFVLTGDIFVSGSGSVGIAFRVKDRKNMFLFEMRQVRSFEDMHATPPAPVRTAGERRVKEAAQNSQWGPDRSRKNR